VSAHNAKPKTIDGITFASGEEAARYAVLKMLARGGAITGLELQPEFVIFNHGGAVIRYKADFRYQDGDARETVEEVKGFRDTAYLLRRKMFLGLFPHLNLFEIRGKKRLRVYLSKGGICRTREEKHTQ
jgi:hypothetical protein